MSTMNGRARGSVHACIITSLRYDVFQQSYCYRDMYQLSCYPLLVVLRLTFR